MVAVAGDATIVNTIPATVETMTTSPLRYASEPTIPVTVRTPCTTPLSSAHADIEP